MESGDCGRRFPFGSSGARFPFERSRGGEVGAAVSHGRKGGATQKKSHQKIVLLLFFLVVRDEFRTVSIGVIRDIKGGLACQGNMNNACQVHIRDCSHDTFKKEVKSR